MAHTDTERADALIDYKQGVLTTKEIAAKYGISQSTLTVWATQANQKLRTRGRRKMDEPTAKQKEILKLAEVHTYEYIGRQFGMEKQAVHRIIKRWKNWMKPKKPMFVAGDIILWRGQKYTVLWAGMRSGMVMDKHNNEVREFPWNHNGKLPRKVGFNPAYATAG
jgi:transposase